MSAAVTGAKANEKFLIVSTAEVRAILEGRKTQKRVPIKHKLEADMRFAYEDGGGNWIFWSGPVAADMAAFTKAAYPNGEGIPCPFGKRGDHLWLREALRCDDRGMFYAADETLIDKDLIPNNLKRVAEFCDPFHMPRWASRITLEITNVRVERVSEISDADAIAEGIRRHDASGVFSTGADLSCYATAREAFAHGWDSINKKRGFSFDSNIWVWVIEFRKL